MPTAHNASLRRWLLSLPPVEYALQQVREIFIGALRCGPVPRHIAFVMDGNRRYAREHKLETVEGHHLGFEALAKILEVCYKSGVEVVTIYAFSIENFKRSKYEVDGLMDLAKTKLTQMSQHGDLLDRYGASVRILGDLSLVREDVMAEVNRSVEMTAHNDQKVLNICFPYTSREEITRSIKDTVKEYSVPADRSGRSRPFSESRIQRSIRTSRRLSNITEEDRGSKEDLQSLKTLSNGQDSQQQDAESTEISEQELDAESTAQPSSSQTSYSPSPESKPSNTSTKSKPSKARPQHLPDPETLTAEHLTKNTYTSNAPPLDLLVRTSGVYRLSDFMLWQCHEETEMRFLDCLWPDFDLWSFLPVLVEWQWRQRHERHEEGTSKLVKGI